MPMVINALYYVELHYTASILYVYPPTHTILLFPPFLYKNITDQLIFTSLFLYYSVKSLKAAGLLIGATWIFIATDIKATRPHECLLKIALFVTKIKCLVDVMHKIN